VELIDQSIDLSIVDKKLLADDIIHLLMTDFGKMESKGESCVSLFKPLLKVTYIINK